MSDPAVAYEDRKWTYADYKEWELKPGERFELIYGTAYAMSAPNAYHQSILVALVVEFGGFLKGKPCKVYPGPYDVRLFYEEDESDDTVVQPDLAVVCDPAKRGEEGCRGAPELVVEILSPSNTAIEMQRKLFLYRNAGVGEYWIVDPKNKQVSVYRLKEGEYYMTGYHLQECIRSPVVPGLEISLETVFAE